MFVYMKQLVSCFMVKLVIEVACTVADNWLLQLKSNKKAFLMERSFNKKASRKEAFVAKVGIEPTTFGL
jgi:hypothetical protein